MSDTTIVILAAVLFFQGLGTLGVYLYRSEICARKTDNLFNQITIAPAFMVGAVSGLSLTAVIIAKCPMLQTENPGFIILQIVVPVFLMYCLSKFLFWISLRIFTRKSRA